MTQNRSELAGLRAWREQMVPVESPEAVEGRRARLLPAVERAMKTGARRARANSARRTQLRAAAAAVVVVGGGLAALHGLGFLGGHPGADVHVFAGSGRLVHAGHTTELSASSRPSAAMAGGDFVETSPDGNLVLSLPSGASVVLGPRGRAGLDLAQTGAELVRLESGVVQAHVPKLGPSGQLSVRTTDAVVTVHGTIFSVSAASAEPHGGGTWVAVTEGIVSVQCTSQAEIRLGPGESHKCPDPSSATRREWAPVPVQAAEEPAAQDRASRDPAPREPAPRPDPRKSSLGAENRLLGEVMAARLAGDDPRTIELTTQFMDRYPTSPLLEEVYVERFRAHARTGDRDGASRWAAQYLMVFHDGFARDEARSLVVTAGRSSGP
jgi:hypothetical protein